MQDISLLESFLLKPYEESLKNLVKGSDEYYYFHFLKLFKEKGCDLTKEQKNELSDFISRDTTLSEQIKKRKLFAQLDKYSGDQRRRRIIFGLLREYVFQEPLEEDVQNEMNFGYDEVSVVDEEEIVEEPIVIEDNEENIEKNQKENDEIEGESDGLQKQEGENVHADFQQQEQEQQQQNIDGQEGKIELNEEGSEHSGKISQHSKSEENIDLEEQQQSSQQQPEIIQQEEPEEPEQYNEEPEVLEKEESEIDLQSEKFIPSQFDETLIRFETLLERIHTYGYSGLIKMEPAFYHKINFEQLLKRSCRLTIEHYLEHAQDLNNNPYTIQLINELVKKEKKINYFEYIFSRLNENQLQELRQLNKDFQQNKTLLQELYQKKFIEKQQQLKENQKQEIFQLKLDGYNYLIKLPETFKNQQITQLEEVINYGLENQFQIPIDIFLSWVKDKQQYFKVEQQNEENKQVTYHIQNQTNFLTLRKYFEEYLQTNTSLNEFSPYISQEILDQFEAEIKLLKGEHVENITKILPKVIIDEMNAKTYLELTKANKNKFFHGEQVNLICKIKNVQVLKVKIFQINCENYCKINQQNVNINIPLDGIIPTDEIDFQYQNPPIQVFYKEFRFELIEKHKQGAFIIEFYGNGLTARALITKGRLHVSNKITSIGHRIQILDENNEISKGNRTGIWLGNQFYQPNHFNEILIPFGTSSNECSAIIVCDDYAEVDVVKIHQENYQLSCTYVSNEELFVSETESQIFILPELKVANYEIDIAQLKDSVIKVESFNKSDKLIYQHQEQVKFQKNKPLNFSFRNLSNLELTKFTLTGNVYSQSQKTEIKLDHEYTIKYETDTQLSKQFVQFTEENGYQIQVLGKNGEAYQNLVFKIEFYPIFLKESITTTLKTDSFGKITLGKLQDIYKFTSICQQNSPQAPQRLDFDISNKETPKTQIKIVNPQLTQQGNMKILEFNIQQVEQNYTILILASQFLNQINLLDEFGNKLKKLVAEDNQSQLPKITINNSVYQSNERLKMEIEYVLNRRSKSGYIGNSLEKPNLLLKKQYLRETTQDEENDIYSDAEEVDVDDDDERNSYRCEEECERAPRKKKAKKKKCAKMYNVIANQSKKPKQIETLTKEFQVSTQQNFLQVASQSQFIERSDKDSYQVRLPNYVQQVQILIVNQHDFNSQIFGWQSQALYQKDLTHKSKLQLGKFYSPYRESILLREGQEHTLNNVSSTNYKIISSYQEVFEACKSLSEYYESYKEELEYFLTWNQLKLEEKLKIYNLNQCDELNIFLYFKDFAFFEIYVQEYIQNKIEKSVIDYFLLQETQQLKKFSSSSKFVMLNALEQSLVFIYFNEIAVDKTITQQILNFIEVVKKDYQTPDQVKKGIFDKLVGFQSEEQTQNVSDSENDNYGRFGGGGGGEGGGNYNAAYKQNECIITACCEQEMYNCDDEYQREECDRDYRQNSDRNYQSYKNISIQPFKNIKPTCEYCESHYKDETQLIMGHKARLNDFFFDLIKFSQTQGIMKKGFISENFIYNDISEQFIFKLTLALLELPQKIQSQVNQIYQGQDLMVVAQTPCIIFKKQLRELPKQINKQILVIQKFFDPQNRYKTCDGEQEEIELQEFEVKKIYSSEIVITNCSSKRINLFLLQEIPNGAIPINSPNYYSTIQISLPAYKSKTLKSEFYFPNIGQFSIYPAVVSTEKAVIAVADNYTFIVVENSQIINKENLEDIIQKGSKEDLLEFIKKNPTEIGDSQLSRFFKDKNFYFKCTQILRDELQLRCEILKYSLYHNDLDGFKEYLQELEIQEKLQSKFTYLKCQFVEVSIRFLEYYPILGKRVHNLSKSEQGILNVQLKQQYLTFLNYLVIKQDSSNTDKIIFCYYLLLQQRVNETIQIFKGISIPLQKGEPILQYDYLSAYLDLYIGYPNFSTARQICEKYISYPIIYWRNMFYEVLNMLAEFDGDEDRINQQVINESQKQNFEQALKEEQLNIIVENDQTLVTYANINQVLLEYYLIDLEIVFSRNPFLNDNNFQNYTYTKPLKMDTLDLALSQQQNTISHRLPDELINKNLIIVAKSKTKQSSFQYIKTKLQVNISENSGQLRIYDLEGKYLEKVYIKTFVQKNDGSHQFYKDGYTDLRGRFNYATLDAESLEDVKKFAILIVSNDLGSMIKEVQPPSQLGNFEKEIKLQSKKWAGKAEEEQNNQETVYYSKLVRCKK